MRLDKPFFDAIKNGKKTREYRLYDEKRQRIKIGDIIEFRNRLNMVETIEVMVTGITPYKTFYEMYNKYFDSDFKDRYNNVQAVVDDTYNNWWSKEEEKQYGGVIIDIKLL